MALSKRGRRMVWVALLNLTYLTLLVLISNPQTDSDMNRVLERSICNRTSASVKQTDMVTERTCNHSSTETPLRDKPSPLSSGIADETQGSENVEEQITHTTSGNRGTAFSQPMASLGTLRTKDRGRRHKREVSVVSVLSTNTSMPLDTRTYHTIKPSHENTTAPVVSSSTMPHTSPSPPRPSTPLSPLSAPSLLPTKVTAHATNALPKAKTAEIKTHEGKGIELSRKNLSTPEQDPHDASKSSPSEAAGPGVNAVSPDHANPYAPSGHLHLDITVNATGVTLAVDGTQVYRDLNRSTRWGSREVRLHAGLHLVSLHPTTGHLTAASSFMTWQATSDAQFLKALRDTQDGRLLLVAGVPDFTTCLEEEVISVLENMGSLYAGRLAYKDAWCLLLHKGRGALHEVLVTSRPGHNYTAHDVPPLITRVTVPRTPERPCGWHATPGLEERAAFCRTYDGYGAFCSCQEPPWSPRPSSPVAYAAREVIPVAVVTARRLPRLVHQLAQLWACPGGLHTPVSIFVDGTSPEARSLAALLKVPVTEHHSHIKPGSPARINVHMKHVVTEAFKLHPEADKVIILEDDLDLAPDFIPFFQQTASLLSEDSSLFCVNAYNYNAYEHTAVDAARLYRVHGIPAYGWMVRRHVAEEMVRHWAAPSEGVDWDLWLHRAVMGDRDVLVPEVPRTKHVGGGGVHVTGLEQALYHGRRPLNTRAHVTLDLQGLQRHRYHHLHRAAIAGARVVRFTEHPCKALPLPRRQLNQTFVVYIDVPKSNLSDAFYVVARCLGLSDRNAHESLEAMFTSSFFGNQLYIVGCPVSPFCLTKDPKDVYKPSPEDRLYANQHPFRPANLQMHMAIRIPPFSLFDLVNLDNLIHYNITYT